MSHSLSPDVSVRNLFLKACGDGQVDLVSVLLAHHANVNWKGEGEGLLSGSGLHYAVLGGHREMVDLLLAQPGVDVNITDDNNRTPLMVACYWDVRSRILRRMLQVEGLHLNNRDESGLTALHVTVFSDSSSSLKLLKGVRGLDWNVKEKEEGLTPVALAVILGLSSCLEVILTLPGHRVDLTVEDEEGRNLAWLAVVDVVVEGYPIYEEKTNPLRCVQLLCQDERVDWNTKNNAGDTPLMFCLKNNKVEMARLLLSNPRVDIHTSNNDGKYPENIAREKNLREILDLMKISPPPSLESRIPDCPVCFEKFSKNSEVHHCKTGHFVCGSCRPRVRNCPTCRGRILGRAHGFEEFLDNLDD